MKFCNSNPQKIMVSDFSEIQSNNTTLSENICHNSFHIFKKKLFVFRILDINNFTKVFLKEESNFSIMSFNNMPMVNLYLY